MGVLRAVLWLGAVATTSAAVGTDSFPYVGYVATNDAYVRSGPGYDYYPTEKLQKGDTVEVYRHDPGGWYAVRPPAGSFSWSSARYVQPVAKGLGKVIGDRVVARVGSRFSAIRDVIQVHLDRGEIVEVLDESNTGGQTWFKIAPPAGEFRWIHGQLVDASPPHDGVSRPRPGGRRLPFPNRVKPGARNGTPRATPAWERAAFEPDREDVTLSPISEALEEHEEHEEHSDSVQKPQWSALAQRASEGKRAQMPAGAAVQAGGRTQHEAAVDDLELDLSIMVAEEPTVWTFPPHRQRADQLFDESKTALERGRARRLLNKIARLEDIKLRYDQVHGSQVASSFPPLPAATTTTALQARIAETPPSSLSSYDGVGVLRPVYSKRTNAPPYALVDSMGIVVSFVSPGPDVNLQPYLGHEVGISGTRGFMPDYNRAHLMAQRVAMLEGNKRVK